MAEGDGAAIGVQARIVEGQAQLFCATEHLGGKGLVDFDQVHVSQRQLRTLQGLGNGGHRPQAHQVRRHAGDGARHDPRSRPAVVTLAHGQRTDHQCRRAIVDARGVAGGGHALGKQRLESAQCFNRAVRARVLVAIDDTGWPLASLGHFDGQYLVAVQACIECGLKQRLAACRISIGLLATDTQFAGDVVGGCRHGVSAELGLDPWIRKARANGAVEGGEVPRPGALRLGHNKGGAAHAFRATCNKQLALASPHRAGRIQHGGQARATQAIDCHPGHRSRQPGQQRRMAGQVARILASLVAAPGDQVFVVIAGKGIARHQRAHQGCQQVVRAYAGQCTGIPTERRAQTIVKVSAHLHSSGVVNGKPSCTRRRNQGLTR
ncbi:hypothetical protein D9M71_132180 [compost metagenome]